MKKLVSIIIVLCCIGVFVMSIFEIAKSIGESEWKPTEVYEFANKNIEWD